MNLKQIKTNLLILIVLVYFDYRIIVHLLQTEEEPREVLVRLAEEREPMYQEVADYVVRTDEQSAKLVANQIAQLLGL